MRKGKLILIPCPIGDNKSPFTVFPQENIFQINSCTTFIVENIRSARRFLKKLKINTPFSELRFFTLNKKTKASEIPNFLEAINSGQNTGVISEAGCPCIADPGSRIVEYAHKKNIEVIPLVGPSAILLSLMASGMNGQNFAFIGYLPKEKTQRIKKIKKIEYISEQNNQTQIFIETPYRNNNLINDLILNCSSSTKITIASDLTLESQYIKTKYAKDWRKEKVDFNKKPTIFLIHKY